MKDSTRRMILRRFGALSFGLGYFEDGTWIDHREGDGGVVAVHIGRLGAGIDDQCIAVEIGIAGLRFDIGMFDIGRLDRGGNDVGERARDPSARLVVREGQQPRRPNGGVLVADPGPRRIGRLVWKA